MLANTEEVGTAVNKAVGMIVCMPGWHVSLRLPPLPLSAVESTVTLSLLKQKKNLQYYKGQLLAMARGQPVDKTIKPEAASAATAPDEGAQAPPPDAKDNKEIKLAPFPAPPAVPSAKLLPFPKRPAAPASESSSSRAPPPADRAAAAKMEKDRQTRSSTRDKRQKETEQSKAPDEEKPAKKTRKTRSSKPAADKSKRFGFMDSDSDTS